MPVGKIIVRVRNTTPLLIGWYDPLKQDPMGLRSTEIKGIWRWWARAFIGGALYDNGYLKGVRHKDVYLKPSTEETRVVSCFVGHVLGLGIASSRGVESEASRFSIMVMYPNTLRATAYKQKQTPYQRINLLTIKRAVEGLDTGNSFEIHIEKEISKYSDAEELALKMLIIALQFMGVGKGSRRGLGSLDICDIHAYNIARPMIPNSIRELIKEVYERCFEIIEKYGRECKLSKLPRGEAGGELPPFPIVSRSSIGGINVTQMYVLKNTTVQHFVDIHNFFLRSERCRKLFNIPVCYDDLRRSLSAWVLGLPREQRGTGYRIGSSNVSRRASPATMAFHREGNIFGAGAFIAMFMSGDWPTSIEWLDASRRRITINRNTILTAYVTFLSEFDAYLQRIGLNLAGGKIWP